jgi:type I restriction enzyme M protein
VKHAEKFYQDIHWLQERFPRAEYEDVTGLCKLAGPADVAEQEYSLNPGRYVGVVIAEDGKTEAEFIDEAIRLNDSLETLNREAAALGKIVGSNLRTLVDEK